MASAPSPAECFIAQSLTFSFLCLYYCQCEIFAVRSFADLQTQRGNFDQLPRHNLSPLSFFICLCYKELVMFHWSKTNEPPESLDKTPTLYNHFWAELLSFVWVERISAIFCPCLVLWTVKIKLFRSRASLTLSSPLKNDSNFARFKIEFCYFNERLPRNNLFWPFQKTVHFGPCWWSSGLQASLLLWRSKFKSLRSLHFKLCKIPWKEWKQTKMTQRHYILLQQNS